MGKSTISTAMFNSYVCLSEGKSTISMAMASSSQTVKAHWVFGPPQGIHVLHRRSGTLERLLQLLPVGLDWRSRWKKMWIYRIYRVHQKLENTIIQRRFQATKTVTCPCLSVICRPREVPMLAGLKNSVCRGLSGKGDMGIPQNYLSVGT